MPSLRTRFASLRSRPQHRELGAAIGLTLLAATGLIAPATIGGALAQTPERIVVAGGVITEVLYALGLEGKIVGVDTTSQFPAEALRDKPSIGYVRALSAEGVLSLKPSLVIAVEGAGPPDAVSLLNEAGLKLARISEDNSPEGVVTKIEAIGAVAGAAEPAKRLAQQTKARFDELATLRTALPAKKKVLFVLSLQNGRVLVGGRNSSADSIIAMAGGVNVAAAVEGYKPMTDEAILAAAPDVVLMMRNSGGHNATPEELFAMPAFAQTPAAAGKSLVRMDALYLLGFGPRTPAAARDLMAELYPDAKIPPLKTAAATAQ
ncbi:hemin ABC transporter substrate-binding protein [Bosea caraganae]|uniref:Hemin ABC transporter substrate-binding protein n=1 Tax=Bosea caraganae TaxID=2763117 RepID=A0A370L0F2_9HYPH|nr:ABC transporter substrate-binding protein [Bosea caraganae]RDJ20734.1 hemin ABC transporter substrate-binding protein [Bosea caraganae]RDJ29011.1 hemin ABC transporter substrate-binding protein [Bosea caraganae]